MHDATKQLNALAGDHKESPLGEHEIALRGSRSADQSGRIKCEERPVACIIQVKSDPWILVIGRDHQKDDAGDQSSQVTKRAGGILRKASVGGGSGYEGGSDPDWKSVVE